MLKINTVQRQRDQVGEGKSLCLRKFSSMCGKISQNPGAADAKWTRQIENQKRYPSYQDAVGRDGEAIEFEWQKFPRMYNLVQKRNGTVAHMMDNGTVQPTKWYSNSKKLVILFSQPPVLRVAEC